MRSASASGAVAGVPHRSMVSSLGQVLISRGGEVRVPSYALAQEIWSLCLIIRWFACSFILFVARLLISRPISGSPPWPASDMQTMFDDVVQHLALVESALRIYQNTILYFIGTLASSLYSENICVVTKKRKIALLYCQTRSE